MSVYPTEIRASLDDEINEMAFEYSEIIPAPGNGEWIEFPNGVAGAAAELEIAVGVGYVEATLDDLTKVKADTATGKKWDKGDVSETTQDYVVPVTAIRAVNISGEIKIKVRMQ